MSDTRSGSDALLRSVQRMSSACTHREIRPFRPSVCEGAGSGPPMFDPHRLRLLRERKHRGTLAPVAAVLSYAPSSVSQQLSQLEAEVGVPLLEPVGRRVTLTAQAEMLVAPPPAARRAEARRGLPSRPRVERAAPDRHPAATPARPAYAPHLHRRAAGPQQAPRRPRVPRRPPPGGHPPPRPCIEQRGFRPWETSVALPERAPLPGVQACPCALLPGAQTARGVGCRDGRRRVVQAATGPGVR